MKIEDLPTPSLTDPPEYLESLRLPLIQRLKKTLEETDDEELVARICVNLLKFSSMGRSSVDLVHSLKRDELPDLSKLFSEADLERLVEATPAALEGLAKRLEIAEQATRVGSAGLDREDTRSGDDA
mgnify:FL=1